MLVARNSLVLQRLPLGFNLWSRLWLPLLLLLLRQVDLRTPKELWRAILASHGLEKSWLKHYPAEQRAVRIAYQHLHLLRFGFLSFGALSFRLILH